MNNHEAAGDDHEVDPQYIQRDYERYLVWMLAGALEIALASKGYSFIRRYTNGERYFLTDPEDMLMGDFNLLHRYVEALEACMVKEYGEHWAARKEGAK